MSTKLDTADAAGARAEEPRSDDPSRLLASILSRDVSSGGLGAVLGVLVGFGPSNRPIVSYETGSESRVTEARSCVPLNAHRIGREVVLLFVNAGSATAVIMGVIEDDLEPNTPRANVPARRAVHDVEADGDRLVITSEREIVLRCGQASITLTREGKLLLRGTYVSSRSAGVNRIKGGSVEIN